MTSLRLWGILGIALALRAALMWPVFAQPSRALTPDSGDYLWLVSSLREQGSYTGLYVARTKAEPSSGAELPPIGPFHPRPEIFRSPGYPALLAGEWRACELGKGEAIGISRGGSAFGFHKELARATVAFQVLLDVHLVLLTFFLGRRLVGQGLGLAAAMLQAISPLAIASSCRILSDGVFAFLLTAAVLLILRHFRTGGWWSLLAAAGVMGMACYVRPVGVAMASVMVLVLLFRARRIPRTATFAAVLLAFTAPWVVRNAAVADYLGFSSFATDSMYWYSAAEVVARGKRVPVEDVRREFRRQEGWDPSEPSGRFQATSAPSSAPCFYTPGGLARYRWQRAKEIILAHPWMYLGIHMKGCMAFWLPGATDVLEIAGLTTGGKGTLDVLHRQGLWAAVRHYFGDNTKAMWLAAAMLLVPLVKYAGLLMLVLGKLRLPWRRGGVGNGDRHRNGQQRAVSVPVPVSQAGSCEPAPAGPPARRAMGAEVWLCLLLVLLSFLLPGPAAHPRFRVPVEPILSVAAAAGWAWLAARRRARRGTRDAGTPGEVS